MRTPFQSCAVDSVALSVLGSLLKIAQCSGWGENSICNSNIRDTAIAPWHEIELCSVQRLMHNLIMKRVGEVTSYKMI